jgi:hypothetical protein
MPSTLTRNRTQTQRAGLRVRMLLAFLAPVVILGVGGVLLLGVPGAQLSPSTTIRGGSVFLGLTLVTLLMAVGLAIHMGDRVARPVAWLLRLMDAGQVKLLSKGPPPAGDWEIETLSRRVQVLLRQNLSGAEAMEELDALRGEIVAVLDAAVVGRLDPKAWPKGQATHPQTRRLLDFFRVREESLRDATQGLARLEKLLEQDWRSETQAVQEIAERSERAFLGQTELALELERLDRLSRPAPDEARARQEMLQTLADLKLGFSKWRQQVGVALDGTQPQPPEEEHLLARLHDWGAWVDESLEMLAATLSANGAGEESAKQRLSAGLEKVARASADSGQEMGALSREAARLQRAWEPLGERLRSMLVRIGEVQGGPGAARNVEPAAETGEGGVERDGDA